MKWILRHGSDYYRGNTYIFQGGYYPALVRRDEAKRYTSEARAEAAAKRLSIKVGEDFDVEQVSE